MSLKYDFVGHNILDFGDLKPDDSVPINNVIVRTEKEKLKWIEKTTERIGDWRAKFRSTYIGWAITINGLHVANSKYSDQHWIDNHAFRISSVRDVKGAADIVPIALWDSSKVASAHLKPIPMLCCYGLIDLYSCLEEFVFDFYKIYWRLNPQQLIQGSEYRKLRRLHRNKDAVPDQWEAAFSERLEKWQRKKLYDGLGNVFKAYCHHVGLTAPSWYQKTNIDTWAECIDGFSHLRNCLIHGAKFPNQELVDFSTKSYRMGFNFLEGHEIMVTLEHLMNVECFCDSLLTGINASLFEKFRMANKTL